MTNDKIREVILTIVSKYHISRVDLFGSRAAGNNREDSDVDLIVEFSCPITLLWISRLQIELEELLGLDVDVVHGPMRDSDILEIDKKIELYAA